MPNTPLCTRIGRPVRRCAPVVVSGSEHDAALRARSLRFRDRLSQPVIEGSNEEPTPGSGAALKPGEFLLGYPDECGPTATLPQPDALFRNGIYAEYRRLQEHVALFRDYLRENAQTPDE